MLLPLLPPTYIPLVNKYFFKRTIFYKTLYALLFLVVTVVTSDFDLKFCQIPSGLMPVTTKAILVVTMR